MKGNLSQSFGSEKNPELSLEARLVKLPENDQQKYNQLLAMQERRKIEFHEDLNKQRPRELERSHFEELKKLTTPALRPSREKRSSKDIEKEAKLNAQKHTRKNEDIRKERLENRFREEREYFIENAKRKQRSPLQKQFRQRTHEQSRKGLER